MSGESRKRPDGKRRDGRDVDKLEGQETESEEVVSPDIDIDRIQADLEKARGEADEYLDSLQRLKADFDNARKRMIKEQSEFLWRAAEQVVAKLIPVLDSFDRALAVPADAGGDEHFRQGMEMVRDQFIKIVEAEGLTAIDPLGEEFDPNKHEALMQVESDEHDEGQVVEVVEKGYEFRGRAIRPARVNVAG